MKTQHVSRMVLAATLCWLGGAQVSLADSSSGSSNVGGKTPSEGNVPHDKRTDLTGGQPGIPEEYATTPVRQGALKEVQNSKWLNKEVTNKQGEKLGKITKVLKDEKTQKEEYVFMEIAGTRDARPLPVARFQQSGDKYDFWGRPAYVHMMGDGSMLLSDEQTGAIYRISYERPKAAAKK